jgi:hypothetical protein
VLRQLLSDGLAIARGEGLWPAPAPPPAAEMKPAARPAPAGLKQPIRWE